MPLLYRTTFEELCRPGAKSGYALEKGVVIKREDIANAIILTANNIDELMTKVEVSSGRHIKSFYIGKSHVRERKIHRFNPESPCTWRLDSGVNARYKCHVNEGYGRDGLIVVAVVTEESIPDDCMISKSITHHEEYALTLEKRLIQKYMKRDNRLCNKSTEPGKTDKKESKGYTIYVCYVLQGKLLIIIPVPHSRSNH